MQVPQRMQASGSQELQKMLATSSWTFSDQMQNQNRGNLVHNKPQQLSLLFEIRRLSWHVLGELSQKCIVAMKRTSFSPESIGTSEHVRAKSRQDGQIGLFEHFTCKDRLPSLSDDVERPFNVSLTKPKRSTCMRKKHSAEV